MTIKLKRSLSTLLALMMLFVLFYTAPMTTFAAPAAHFEELVLTGTNSFTDVPPGHWAEKYIESVAAKGWIKGYPDGSFMPEANIIRAEAVTIVCRMLNRPGDPAYLTANAGSLPKVFSDVTPEHWAYVWVMEASTGHDYSMDGDAEHWTAVNP